MSSAGTNDVEMVAKLRDAHKRLRNEIGKVIIGQEEVLDQLLMAIFCRSHALLMGVPGLAKTLMVSTLAQALDMSFKRIQFTPDLMPSDITGSEVIQDDPATRQRMFKFLPGPLFANIVLADEINRTPPKTQAALLESMQERKASIGGQDYPMRNPFFVLATQNPIEQEGTYPLPEAQLDRFLFLIKVDYPTDAEEDLIMRAGTSDRTNAVTPVLNGDDIIALQHVVRRVPVSDKVFSFAKRITRSSRPNTPDAADFSSKWLTWGAGPRASMNLILAAKAHALLRGSNHVAGDDVVAVALPILRHRLILNFAALSEGVTVEEVVKRLLKEAARAVAA
ncbi:AAA family ATPase [Fimbriiglobus ruber]|uniref:MoxR-like ATPase in aerotolerance operon n=1 Tax=Fimbriiglobus ruber TaxID=1908690 RepID=A0A225DYV7_9BACT|nr:MoxR family ATPase [Fimbriiglobus ruber]OWK46710.1 MoxR-like ATPase in aerotolerance operon [Fimbriiglobus ruber]